MSNPLYSRRIMATITSMRNRDIAPDHRQLADQFSVAAHEKWLKQRDKSITRLYYEYGLHETMRLAGWTKPTILACVARSNGG